MMEYPKFRVCVRCFTFNQSKYITDAMNGFCMQQTSFPFVCCIVDDASTDGEQQVIKDYVDKHFNLQDTTLSYEKETEYGFVTFAQHNVNKNCFFAVLLLKENHYQKKKSKLPYIEEWRVLCDYEALCEGDDFWTNTNKLQLQMNYIENNPECSLIYTDFDILYESSGRKLPSVFKNKYRKPSMSFVEHLMRRAYIGPCTWLYKKCVLDDYMNNCNDRFVDGTFAMALDTFATSQVYYMPENTGTYRLLNESASHSKSMQRKVAFLKGLLEEQLFYMEKYPNMVDETLRIKVMDATYTIIFTKEVALKNYEAAKKIASFWREHNLKKCFGASILCNPVASYLLRVIYRKRGYEI